MPEVFVLVVGALRDATLRLHLEPFELVLQPDVDHAGDGVRSPLRRCAPGHDLHAIDHECGNGIEVHRIHDARVRRRRRRRHPESVHENQRALATQAAQIRRIGTGSPVLTPLAAGLWVCLKPGISSSTCAMLGASSRSITSEPTTVVGVDAEKPGSAARELVTTISSSSAGCCSAAASAHPRPGRASRPHQRVSPGRAGQQKTCNRNSLWSHKRSPLSAVTTDVCELKSRCRSQSLISRLISKTYQRDL